MLKSILTFAHDILAGIIEDGDTVIDATVGNGHDTLFLAQRIGNRGMVYGFDIQDQAIHNTFQRLQEHNVQERVTLFNASHDEIISRIPAHLHGQIKGAIYNLGYLPGGNKTIVTTPKSTLDSLKQIMQLMIPGGIAVLVVYHGHPEGKTEMDAVMNFCREQDQQSFRVLKYEFINQKNDAPFIIAIEKKKA